MRRGPQSDGPASGAMQVRGAPYWPQQPQLGLLTPLKEPWYGLIYIYLSLSLSPSLSLSIYLYIYICTYILLHGALIWPYIYISSLWELGVSRIFQGDGAQIHLSLTLAFCSQAPCATVVDRGYRCLSSKSCYQRSLNKSSRFFHELFAGAKFAVKHIYLKGQPAMPPNGKPCGLAWARSRKYLK